MNYCSSPVSVADEPLHHGRELDRAKRTAGLTLTSNFRLFDHDSDLKDLFLCITQHRVSVIFGTAVLLFFLLASTGEATASLERV